MRKFLVFLIIVTLYTDLFPQQLVIRLSEGFESSIFPPTGWKKISPLGAKVWERKTAPLPSEIMQPPIQGIAVARIDLEYTGGDDWLITKKINAIESGDSLLFYLIKQYDSGPYPPDSMIIKVSTTDSLMNSFTNIALKINIAGIPIGNQVWRRYSTPLSQFSGQNIFIAFQHKNVNGHGCAIDSIVVFNPNSIGIKKIGNFIPDKSALYQNYPNPFNPNTIIRFQIKEARFATLKVFNIFGSEVMTLVKGELQPGTYEIPFSGSQLPSGIYFYRLEIDDFSAVRTMILIK